MHPCCPIRFLLYRAGGDESVIPQIWNIIYIIFIWPRRKQLIHQVIGWKRGISIALSHSISNSERHKRQTRIINPSIHLKRIFSPAPFFALLHFDKHHFCPEFGIIQATMQIYRSQPYTAAGRCCISFSTNSIFLLRCFRWFGCWFLRIFGCVCMCVSIPIQQMKKA